MSYTPIDGALGTETNESLYYQKIKKDLQNKTTQIKGVKEEYSLFKPESLTEKSFEIEDQLKRSKAKAVDHEKSGYESFKDEAKISSYEWKKKVLEQKEITVQTLNRQVNPREKHLKEFVTGYSINFMKKVPELKEMFKFNVVEACSHQDLVGKFSQFKVGVIGQILSLLGIPQEELRKLKKQAMQEAFESNISEMADNIYHEELSELIHGKTRKTKSAGKVYSQYRTTLTAQMNQLGRPGYWSNARMLEERAKQCYKIEQELSNEKDALKYRLDYLLQESF